MFRPEQGSSADRALAGGYDGPEAFLDDLFGHAWTDNRRAILLVYSVFGELSREDRRAVLRHDAALVGRIERYIRTEAGLPDDDPRAAVVANLVVFPNAFVPFRDWYTRDVSDEVIRRTVVDGVAAIIRGLADEQR